MTTITEKNEWHLDKRLNISHLVATFLIVVGLFSWGAKLEERIAIIERTNAITHEQSVRDLNDIKAALIRIEERLNRGNTGR